VNIRNWTKNTLRRFGYDLRKITLTPDGAGSPVRHKPAARLAGVDYNDEPAIERLLFICGLHRSGTTLLERMLVNRFDLACLRADVHESEGQHMQGVYSPAYKFGGPGYFAFSTAMRRELDTLTDYPRHRQEILDAWQRFVVGTSNVLIEKSPPNLTKITWLRRVFPGARFVILLRDPRAVSAATQKWSKNSLPELMMHWNVAYHLAEKDFDPADCCHVRYEDLCTQPDAVLERIGAFAGLAQRFDTGGIEARFADLANTNGKYLSMHDCEYGDGVWSRFGYQS